MHSNFYSNTRPFGGFGRSSSSAKSSAAEIDRHLAKAKMGFVGSVLFRSNGLPQEICVVHTPTFERFFFGIETAATEPEDREEEDRENRDPENLDLDPEPTMSKEEKMRIKQTLLDFYIRNDLVRDSMINVATEREKTWFCKVGVPACVLTEPEIVRLNTVPSPYRREVPMDMQEHVRRFHRGGGADEECAVRNAFDLQNKYYSVLQHNIVFNTKVANYSDVDWMEGGMWGGGLGGSGGGGASMWGGGLGGGGGGGLFGGGLQSNRRGSGDASDYLGRRRFKPLDPCEL